MRGLNVDHAWPRDPQHPLFWCSFDTRGFQYVKAKKHGSLVAKCRLLSKRGVNSMRSPPLACSILLDRKLVRIHTFAFIRTVDSGIAVRTQRHAVRCLRARISIPAISSGASSFCSVAVRGYRKGSARMWCMVHVLLGLDVGGQCYRNCTAQVYTILRSGASFLLRFLDAGSKCG